MLTLFATTAAAVAAWMTFGWILSLIRRDASIVDILWGAGFVLVAWVSHFVADGYSARSWLVTIMCSVWGLRLAGYLFKRNWGHGEDFRYQAMRAAHGKNFALWSLVFVFGLQGTLMWVISLPLQLAQLWDEPANLTVLDGLAVALVVTGLFFEAVGDSQLARFKADPANAGQVMDRGLWRYTRHPNYFGDSVVWWGLFCFAIVNTGALWVVISPLLMTFFLTRVSGVPMLEKAMMKRKPGYAEYARRTSAFIPLPPKKK